MMKLKDEKKEELKRDIQHPDNERQKREFMDAEQKEELKKESGKKRKIDPEDELKSREDFRDKKGKKE
ncbi:hypothetical protein C7S20_11560 [Christiangramia fulva]|uniref:Uncharacterized protein n=1 Tax=Christiangramia fulva TaxID=2126553 RepID=A0A2R3Z6D3_9FLAO|nr:hypothetical protein [Christiangramia fulva]AVR45836.1 hypothetical protein C7S20_11560 [Christiangramia fulva]